MEFVKHGKQKKKGLPNGYNSLKIILINSTKNVNNFLVGM